MKILFLGYVVGYDIADSLSGISIAGNKMQVNALRGFAGNEDVELDSITVYPVAAFPHDKKVYIKAEDITIEEGITSRRVGFCNLPIVKQFWQTFAVYREAKKHVDKDTIVFTFNLFPQVGLPAMWLKKKYGCRTCSLLADLPIDDKTGSKNIIRNFFRKIFDYFTKKALLDCDSLVVLNKQAAIDYAPNAPYIVVEGGVEDSAILPLEKIAREKKNIVYCGALTEYSGIMPLIEAMKYVTDKDAVLEIYGGGYLTEEVKKISESTSNVKYCGRVSNKEMLAIQRSAYLLVNPRPVDDAIARVTFPSKMFEYMLSGTPVLTTKLNGLSDEFLENLFYVEKGTAKEFADAINDILLIGSEQLCAKAEGAYFFITKEKVWSRQNARIYEFLKKEFGRE